MTNLSKVIDEVSKWRNENDQRKKHFPLSIKKKIINEARKHGASKVAKAIGISRNTIANWSEEKDPLKPIGSKSPKRKGRSIIFKELPPKNEHISFPMVSSENAFLRLTSPAGFTIVLNGNPGSEVTAEIIRAFMGGLV